MKRSDLYRPDIDGLRAVAVLAVVVYHAFPDLLPGGFVGVDIFFVVSGFLITGILLRSLDSGTFSLAVFYGRRVRRIFPALIIVMTSTLVVGLLFLPTQQLQALGKQTVGAMLFVPNLFFWSEAGYFDADAVTKPLLHTWSLGVEEQFYFLWPLILGIVFRYRRALVPTLAAIAVTSFSVSAVQSAIDPTAAFYSPLSRGWELSLGGLAAVYLQSGRKPVNAMFAWIGLGLLFVAVTFTSQTSLFPAPGAAITVIGTCLLLLAQPNEPLGRLLSARPIVYLGLVSYPLYLWHWPLIVYANHLFGDQLPNVMLAVLGVSLLLAMFTYHVIEQPIQRVGLIETARIAIPSALALALAGSATAYVDPRTLMYPDEIKRIIAYGHYDYGTDARLDECWLRQETGPISFSSSCQFGAVAGGPRVAVWGDSHAARLYPGLLSILPPENLAQFTTSSCPPHGVGPFCEAANLSALEYFQSAKPDVVLMFARWGAYADDWNSGDNAARLRTAIAAASATGAKVVLVGPFPEYASPLPDAIVERWKETGVIPSRLGDIAGSTMKKVDTQLSLLARNAGALYVSLAGFLCDEQGCRGSASDDLTDLLSWDYGHLTTAGATLMAKQTLLKLLPIPRS